MEIIPPNLSLTHIPPPPPHLAPQKKGTKPNKQLGEKKHNQTPNQETLQTKGRCEITLAPQTNVVVPFCK